MPSILILVDFDGTMTGRAGQFVVGRAFYQSLLEGYQEGMIADYKKKNMIPEDKIIQAFRGKFGEFKDNFDYTKEDADLLMSPDAIAFFKHILQSNDIQVNIITKNRHEYIKSLMMYQGFTDEEISKLTIIDNKKKYEAVADSLEGLVKSLSCIGVLDDTKVEFDLMLQAVKDSGYKGKLIAVNVEPGTFNWGNYLAEFKKIRPEQVELIEEKHDPLTPAQEQLSQSLQAHKDKLESLLVKLKALRANDLAVKRKQSAEDLAFSKELSALCNALTSGKNAFFARPSPSNFDGFAANYTRHIESFLTKVKTYSDKRWHKVSPLIKAILGVLAAMAIIPALVVQVVSNEGYVKTFFGASKWKKVEGLLQELDNTKQGIKTEFGKF